MGRYLELARRVLPFEAQEPDVLTKRQGEPVGDAGAALGLGMKTNAIDYWLHWEPGTDERPGPPEAPAGENAAPTTGDVSMSSSAASTMDSTWPPESLDAELRFGHAHAKLFPFLGRKVRTPKGPGTLLQVFADQATVLLDSELSRCASFHPGEVEPVSWE